MLTICVGAAVQVLEHRRQAIVDTVRTSEALADHLATALDRISRDASRSCPWYLGRAGPCATGLGRRRGPRHPYRRRRRQHCRQRAERAVMASDAISSTCVRTDTTAAETTDIRRGWTPPRAPCQTATPFSPPCERYATRSIPAGHQQPRSEGPLRAGRSTTALTVTLSATTGFVVLILGFAFSTGRRHAPAKRT